LARRWLHDRVTPADPPPLSNPHGQPFLRYSRYTRLWFAGIPSRNSIAVKKGSKGRDVHKQLKRELFDLCLDRVALVDIIAHYPAPGSGSDAWLAAADLASLLCVKWSLCFESGGMLDHCL